MACRLIRTQMTQTLIKARLKAKHHRFPSRVRYQLHRASPLAVFGDITIEIAAGERLVDYSLNGQQAVLHIEGPEGKAARLVIVSLAAKKVIGQVVLKTSEQ